MSRRQESAVVEVREGDIFEIPAPNGERGFGQVVVSGKLLYVAIFEGLYEVPPNLDELIESNVLLVGWTLDALIFHKRWKIVGNRPAISNRVPLPSYKVLIDGKIHVRDFHGKQYRLASPREVEVLETKNTIAPIRYQNAFLAHHGFGEWSSDYNRLTVPYAQRRVVKL